MNTILITGTAKTVVFQTESCTSFKVEYDVNIWGSKTGEPIQLVHNISETLCGYGELWDKAKAKVASYFREQQMHDGAYTQYLDHITIKK